MTAPLSPLGLAALELSVETGLAIFPIAPRSKQPPLTPNGFHGASSSAEQIAEWWTLHTTANIGAVPGSIDCVVIDSDGPQGEALAQSLGVLDTPTLESRTSRGAHRWFRLPRGVVVGNIARPELDVRSSAGYVVVPPSIHPTGASYEWRGSSDAIADAPTELLQWLTAPPVVPVATPDIPRRSLTPLLAPDALTEARVLKYVERIGYGLSDGRKTAAFRFAAFMRNDAGLSDGAVDRFLDCWNRSNRPPLPERLLSQIATNARRYGGHARGAA
jgi:hypothetical protein